MDQKPANLFDSGHHLLKCRACHGEKLINVVDLKEVPLAGSFYSEPFSGEKLPLGLVHCSTCGLIQTSNLCPRDLIYKLYSYHSGLNPELVAHFDQLASSIFQFAPPPRRIIEIGSNDGSLIKKLQGKGYECLGVDPSDVALESFANNGWLLFNDFLSQESASSILSQYGTFDIAVSCNSLAHNDEIYGIFNALNSLVSAGGLVFVELQNGKETLRKLQFDTVYHEHTCYFTPNSLSNLLNRTGFSILKIEEMPIHNGSIRIVAKKSYSLPSNNRTEFQYAPPDRSEQTYIDSFQSRVEENQSLMASILRDFEASSQTIVGFGASGRAAMMLNHYNLNSSVIKCVVDNSPLKQGMYFACTDIQVRAKSAIRELDPDVIFVFAWNYLDEIISECRGSYGFKGRFLVPLPSPILI